MSEASQYRSSEDWVTPDYVGVEFPSTFKLRVENIIEKGVAGPPGFEPGITNSAGWCLIQARLRPHPSGPSVRLIESSLRFLTALTEKKKRLSCKRDRQWSDHGFAFSLGHSESVLRGLKDEALALLQVAQNRPAHRPVEIPLKACDNLIDGRFEATCLHLYTSRHLPCLHLIKSNKHSGSRLIVRTIAFPPILIAQGTRMDV
jgi:hypothetical protein